MTLNEYLNGEREELPLWLSEFRGGAPLSLKDFFASRVVFYPGSGTDGHAVELFGSAHCAHCFVHADYAVSRTALEMELADPRRGFRGYHSLDRRHLRESDVVPDGWAPHLQVGDMPHLAPSRLSGTERPFGFIEILERDHDLDDTHGARRLAILFLGADGIATYDALFCQGEPGRGSPPHAVFLVDHGFGGNYDRFGRGGLLERLARRCGSFPNWLVVDESTEPWDGFERVPGVEGDRGGMHGRLRRLYDGAQAWSPTRT